MIPDSIAKLLINLLKSDKDIMSPTRLSILLYLYLVGSAKFTEIEKALELTPGNLSSHLKKLTELDLVEIKRGFVDVKPTTVIRITSKGIDKVREKLRTFRDLINKLE